MGIYEFIHNQAISFHCISCKEIFKCKKTLTKKDKEQREEQFKQSGTPECELCQLPHWCCSDKKCTNCCMLNKCNDIVSDYCKANNLECKRALPTTQEAYNKIKNKVSYIVGKYEPTESGKLHAQIYMQFHKNKRQTIKTAKEIFNDESLIFQKKLGGTSEQNRNYILKLYDQCKIHPGCQCDFLILQKFVINVTQPMNEKLLLGEEANIQKKL
ncbi:hypothetical protein C2G38_2043647 [Gigaspora rosea]|uniref:CRESS-DNA virus Rep endonuclease domain-containing protein n=1 Tax=Gigaspora rosea TaxID=44941 RepID=A0A397UM93_9GLOM|nr:hypothetical protein C2G38_2043647 [Gigaspora rosea]